MSFVDQAVSSVLSRSKLKLAHPGASMLHELYATPSDCTSTLAETVQSYHRVRVTSNNLNLNSSSNFTISTSSIISSLWLHVTIAAGGTGFVLPSDGWFFNAIGSIEITFSNSLLQNMVIPGPALRDYLLLSCKDRPQRERLLRLAGEFTYNAATSASIPIGHLLANAAFQAGNYPVDFSVLNGPLLVQVNWNPGYKFAVKGALANAFVPPTAWASCEITGMCTDLVDAAFSVRSAMAQNPSLIYSTPGKYLNSITYNLAGVATGAEQTINLQSAPAGMLQAIVLNIRPSGGAADSAANPSITSSDWSGIATGDALVHGSSVRLSTLRLEYGGQNLVDCRSYREIVCMNMAAFCGDDLSYDERFKDASNNTTTMDQIYHSNLYVIPFGYNMRQIMSGKHSENLPSYSSASMQLRFTVINGVVSIHDELARDVGDNALLQAVQYTVQVTYVIDALVEVSSGSVDMQL